MFTITTSWDDGDVLDNRLAALLERYGMKGTFYITKNCRENRLSEDAIRAIAQRHEVGAHTLTHPDLRALSHPEKEHEIAGSKQWLEGVTGKEVPMFCYPKGLYDDESVSVVKHAGFKGARSTAQGGVSIGDRFLMPTTLQVYPMPLRKTDARRYWWGNILEPFLQRSPVLRALGVPLFAFRSFEALAKTTFDIAREQGGVFHLWGHSWEIERYDMWKPLERVLRYISHKEGCRYLTNGEVLHTL